MALSDSSVRDAGKLFIFTAMVGAANPDLTLVNGIDTTLGTFTAPAGAATTLSAAPAAGATTVSTVGTFTVGTTIDIDTGILQEWRKVTAVSGTGPYTLTLDTALANAHASGAAVTPASPWHNLGHTDLDNDISVDENGGDSDTRGTRQNTALREIVQPTTQFMTINSVQFDSQALLYYFGDGTVAANVFATNGSFAATTRAVLLVFIDGLVKSGIHYPQASIRRAGPPSMDSGSFRKWPLRITPLQLTGQPLERVIDPAIT